MLLGDILHLNHNKEVVSVTIGKTLSFESCLSQNTLPLNWRQTWRLKTRRVGPDATGPPSLCTWKTEAGSSLVKDGDFYILLKFHRVEVAWFIHAPPVWWVFLFLLFLFSTALCISWCAYALYSLPHADVVIQSSTGQSGFCIKDYELIKLYQMTPGFFVCLFVCFLDYIAQASFKLSVLLPQPPEWWDCSHALPHQTQIALLWSCTNSRSSAIHVWKRTSLPTPLLIARLPDSSQSKGWKEFCAAALPHFASSEQIEPVSLGWLIKYLLLHSNPFGQFPIWLWFYSVTASLTLDIEASSIKCFIIRPSLCLVFCFDGKNICFRWSL